MSHSADASGALPAGDVPPPLFLPKEGASSERALIDAAIAAGKVTVCPGVGEGELPHYANRFDGMTAAEARAEMKRENLRKRAVDEKFLKRRKEQGAAESNKPRRRPPRRPPPPKGGQRAYDMRRLGTGWEEIAGALGFSSKHTAYKSARAYAARSNLPWPVEVPAAGSGKQWSTLAERDRAIVEACRQGDYPADVAVRFELSRHRVVEIVKRDAPDLAIPKKRTGRRPKRARQAAPPKPRLPEKPCGKKKAPARRPAAKPPVNRNAERDRQIISDVRAGVPQRVIAEKLGMSNQRISAIVKRDAPELTQSKPLKPDDDAQIFVMRLNGISWDAISKVFGLKGKSRAVECAKRHAQRHGLAWPVVPA